MSNEIFNLEDVKNEYIENTINEYAKSYNKMQIDLAVYMLNDFVVNLVANDFVLLRYEPEPEPVPQQAPQRMQPPVQQQQPMRQAPQGFQGYGQGQTNVRVDPRQRVQQVQQPIPGYIDQNENPFETAEYVNPKTQRMRVDDVDVRREVSEMNEQLNRVNGSVPKQDINLNSEKSKSFVDKIRDMRNPKKKDNINPEE